MYPTSLPYAPWEKLKSGSKGVFCALIMLPGTGSGDSLQDVIAFDLNNVSPHYANPFVPIFEETDALGANQTERDLDRIFEIFNFKVSELANLLGVSRQTIYKWKNGEGISAESFSKLDFLLESIKVFEDAQIRITPQLLRRTLSEGKSFLQIFASGEYNLDTAYALVRLARHSATQRARLDSSSKYKTKASFQELLDDSLSPS